MPIKIINGKSQPIKSPHILGLFFAYKGTLSSSLNSVWNFYTSIKNQGLVILVAECMAGLGSETFQKLIDGRITPERIKNASKYEEGMENLSKQIPMKRMAEPSEISKVVLFVASRMNTYISGQNIVVDGGFTNV